MHRCFPFPGRRRAPSSRPSLASSSRLLAVCLAALLASEARAQFATTVVSFQPGPNANPSFPATNALGGPRGGGLGGGSLDVCVLGVGGSLTLGFAAPIVDGPGADFTCFENGFVFNNGVFSEVTTVEVSTDGVTFVRFPPSYAGPPAPQPAFGSLPMGTFAGLCGGMPVVANVDTGAADPFDPVVSGGESFDLADLATDPAVVAGAVDLANIRFVRLVDVPEGTVADVHGNLIYDNGGATGSADIDAVAVLHAQGSVAPDGPVCDLFVDANGLLHWRLGDPDGISDLDASSLHASVNLAPVPAALLFQAFAVVSFDGNVAELVTGPVTGQGLLAAFAVSVRDHSSGQRSGDQVMVQ